MIAGKRAVALVLGLMLLLGPGAQVAATDQGPSGARLEGSAGPGQNPEVTPPRVSYIHGEVSFWRPGAEDWSPARLNIPLAPGDRLHTVDGGNVEVQVGPRAWVRAAEQTELGLQAHEPDYLQIRVAQGHAAVDVRELGPGHTVEVATPHAAFTIERSGYYRVDVEGEVRTAFTARRGGAAAVLAASGAVASVAAGQRVVLTGREVATLVMETAPVLEPWDHWNYQRTGALLALPAPAHLSTSVYGAAELGQYGTWRTEDQYGAVWVPSGVSAGWSPYSAGRWIWDPRYGWTWLDDAPWGWAPYHYGRWVYVRNVWAWAPGPIVARPRYAPALVVFLGSPLSLQVGPVFWAPLGWGEPCIPWWGPRGFAGWPWWGGWGGPRVVNNIVIAPTIVVRADEVRTFRNVSVRGAVVGMSGERFGRGPVRDARVSVADARALAPVRGALGVQPVPASLTPASGQARRPPEAVVQREVVVRRSPRSQGPGLGVQGLPAVPESARRPPSAASGRGSIEGRGSSGAPDRPPVTAPASQPDRAWSSRPDRIAPGDQTLPEVRPRSLPAPAPPPTIVAPRPAVPQVQPPDPGVRTRPDSLPPVVAPAPRLSAPPRAPAPPPTIVAPRPAVPQVQPPDPGVRTRPDSLPPVVAPAPRLSAPPRAPAPPAQDRARGLPAGPAQPQSAPRSDWLAPRGAARDTTGGVRPPVAPPWQPAAPVRATPASPAQTLPGGPATDSGAAPRGRAAPVIRAPQPMPSPAVRPVPGELRIETPASRPGAEFRPGPGRIAPAPAPGVSRPAIERRGR